MNKKYVNLFNKHKNELIQYFETHKQGIYAKNYLSLFKSVIKTCFEGEISCSNFKKVDFDSYSGTLIIIFRETNSYSINEFLYTYVEYGSCTICDTLLGISEENYDMLPTKQQVNDYMTLCLHMVQRIHNFN